MPLQNHLEALRKRHAEIDSHIAELERAPSVDHVIVAEAKKRKLALKDEIARLQ